MQNNKALLDMIENLDKVIDRAWKLMNGGNGVDQARILEVILKATEMKFETLMASEVVTSGD